MRSIGVREFRDQATSILAAGETLVIERHGEPIGFFVPIVATHRQAGHASLGRLGKLVENVIGDWPVVATALALSAGIWTNDNDFLGTGIATWTTETVKLWLQRTV